MIADRFSINDPIRRAQEIADATARLLLLEERAREVCQKIKSVDLGVDFAAVQLIDRNEGIIQTVHGEWQTKQDVGLGGPWYKTASHSLQGDARFLDIQACVALANPPAIEIISGWDPRFDPFIYRKFGHKHYSRAFLPLIVARDAIGRLVEMDPEQFDWVPKNTDGEASTITLVSRMRPKLEAITEYEVIGTIEAGFDNKDRDTPRYISEEDARGLFKAACKHAHILSDVILVHVLEVIAHNAREMAPPMSPLFIFPWKMKRNASATRTKSGSEDPQAVA